MAGRRKGNSRKDHISVGRNRSLKNSSAIRDYFDRMERDKELTRMQESRRESEGTSDNRTNYREGQRYGSRSQ